jgi:AcrR family transcriptional regulator
VEHRDRSRAGRYHHGDLRAALVDTAIELIAERGGMRGFSMAEASRRLGVAVSAPYAHFADREDLLAAVAVRAFEMFHAALMPEIGRHTDPADRLVAMTGAYVRFAAAQRPLFEVLYEPGPDKARHPEIEAAEQPLAEAFLACVRALSGGGDPLADDALANDLAYDLEASAHGHAAFLLAGGPGQASEAVQAAAERAGRATRALLEGRRLLGRPSRPEEESR